MEDDYLAARLKKLYNQPDSSDEENTYGFPTHMTTDNIDRVKKNEKARLHEAPPHGSIDTILRSGSNGRTPLHEAAGSNSYDAIRKLLEKKADVNATDDYGNTPLHEAVATRSAEIVLILIEYGADVNAINHNRCTPLHRAAYRDLEEIIRILVHHGANINATDIYGQTPLHCAIARVANNVALYLCLRGANAKIADISGLTPLHIAAVQKVSETRTRRLLRFLRIHANAILDAVDIDGRTPLHYAVQARSTVAVAALVRRGANIALRDKYGRTPVYDASCLASGGSDILFEMSFNWSEEAFLFLWEPPEAFKVSKNSDEALEILTNSISLIRQEDRVVATPWGTFVQGKFGVWGLQFLSHIASAFTADDSTYRNDEIIIVAQPTEIQVKSSKFPDKIKELLTWLCLSFRKVQDGAVSISEGDYSISIFFLQKLRSVVEDGNSNSSCWYGLFESAVIAEYRDNSSANPILACWLDVSFDMMIQLSAVEYPLMIEGGIILMGYSTALVPVRMVDDTHVLWHLEVADHDSQLLISELAATESHWLQVDDLDQLRAKMALVGWCPEATILLGTDKLDPNPTWSNGKVKKTSWRWSGANLQFLAQSAAPAQTGAQLGLSMSRTTNTVRFSPSNNYLKCLNNSATEHVILYDLAAERAWLVPLISTFHHMLAIYWNTIPPESRCPALPFATPSADGASASLTLLKERGEFIVEGSAEERSTIRDLVMGFSANLSRVSIYSPFRTEVYGYELMDIVVDSAMADLKRKKVKKEGLGWAPLLSQVRCLFCSGIGNAIIGNKAMDLESPCNELLRGSDLMAATIPSINALSRRSGSDSQGPLCQLSTLHVWELAGNPFKRCQHSGSSGETCWQTMKFLQEIQLKKLKGQVQGSQASTLSKDGAIVFGQKRGFTYRF